MEQRSHWYRLKALALFALYILSTPFWLVLTLTLWTYGHLLRFVGVSKKPSVKLLHPNLRRTVLVTDSPNIKSLHFLRVLGNVGHRIILVDSNQYKGSSSSWSKYVIRTHYVSHHNGPTRNKYIEEVLQVALKEDIDWFIPVSKTRNAIPNYIVAQKLAQLSPHVRSLWLGDLEIAKMLNHKTEFILRCAELGMSVPDARRVDELDDLRVMREEGVFKNSHYFLKPVEDFSEDRLNFQRIPHELNAFNKYVKNYEQKFRLGSKYLVCEYIKGSEFTSNVLCRNGQVFSMEVSATNCSQTEFDAVENDAVKEWTLELCRKMNLTGGLCFDFMQDEATGQIYCIECNPHPHTCVTLHHCHPKLALAIQAVLEPESVHEENGVQFPIVPSKNAPRVYWISLEFYKLLNGKQGLGDFVWTVLHGRDAAYEHDDPLPFLIDNTLNALVQLGRTIVNGTPFGKYNPMLGRLSRGG